MEVPSQTFGGAASRESYIFQSRITNCEILQLMYALATKSPHSLDPIDLLQIKYSSA